VSAACALRFMLFPMVSLLDVPRYYPGNEPGSSTYKDIQP